MAEYTSLSVEGEERSIHTKHVWLRVHRRFLGKRQPLLTVIAFGKGAGRLGEFTCPVYPLVLLDVCLSILAI